MFKALILSFNANEPLKLTSFQQEQKALDSEPLVLLTEKNQCCF